MKNKGFTLVEILIVIGLFTLLFVLGLFMSMESFHGYSRRSERDILVSVLERARSRAMANVRQHPWGACYDNSGPSYVIFSGSNYGSSFSTESVPASDAVTLDLSGAASFPCASGGIVFAQLTGDSSAASVTMTEGAITSTVAVNSMGRVDW